MILTKNSIAKALIIGYPIPLADSLNFSTVFSILTE